MSEIKARRTYKFCKHCDKVNESENGICLVCDNGDKIFDPDKSTVAFKIKQRRHRSTSSQYTRDKMKDLIST